MQTLKNILYNFDKFTVECRLKSAKRTAKSKDEHEITSLKPVKEQAEK